MDRSGPIVRQKFTSYERDAETNLDFAQARYYGFVAGRFTSADPFMGSARLGTPQSWNRYIYVLNDPLGRIDPSGMIMQDPNQPTDKVPASLFTEKEIINVNRRKSDGSRISDAEAAEIDLQRWYNLVFNGGRRWNGHRYDRPSRSGYWDQNVGFGWPVGSIGIGPTGGLQVSPDDELVYFGVALFVPPGPNFSTTYSPDNLTPGLNFELQGSYRATGSVGTDVTGNTFISSGVGNKGLGVQASVYVSFPPPNISSRDNNALNANRPVQARGNRQNCACNRAGRDNRPRRNIFRFR